MRNFLINVTRVDYMGRIIGYGSVVKELNLNTLNLEQITKGLAKDLEWETTEVCISSMCDVTPPASRFSDTEKANLKHWVSLAKDAIGTDSELQEFIVSSLIKELNQ